MKKKVRAEKLLEFEVVFEPDVEDGGYTVTVPKLPGLVTQGDTLTEARYMAKDAIRCYMEGLLKDVAPRKAKKTPSVRRERFALTL